MPTPQRPAKRPTPRRGGYRASRPTAAGFREPQPYRARSASSRRSPTVIALLVLSALVVGGAVGAYALVQSAAPHASGSAAGTDSLAVSEEAFEAPEPEVEPTRITITFAGDCTLGTEESFDYASSFTGIYDTEGPDYFFANVKSIFEADDLTVANCEGVLTTATTREDKEYAYKGDPSYAEIFSRSSVEATSVSNNHIYDYGWNSRGDTLAALADAGVTAFGDEIVAYEDVKGVKVALIGANMLSLGLGIQDQVTTSIHAAQDAGAQIIIVFMHWGTMREYDPTDKQIELAHIAIDAGATVVVGSHQHVLQGYEKYNGRYIVYGLGNFCYGGSRTLGDPDCYIFQQTFTLSEEGIETDDAVEVIPCLISSDSERNNYQPTIAEGADRERIEGKIADSSSGVVARAG